MLNEVDIKSVVWDANGSSVNGPTLEGIPAGTYSVTVTSALGCSKTRNMELGTEIRPYNGISRNGDGQNEIFHINCIDTYPNNLVKIFNRAGTLVYEAERYDNIDVYFDGKSNRGISLIGSNLPDGTYFYVIDKRNGSKPIAGYLEIVN
jgi:gliding motility-associated-like protein